MFLPCKSLQSSKITLLNTTTMIDQSNLSGYIITQKLSPQPQSTVIVIFLPTKTSVMILLQMICRQLLFDNWSYWIFNLGSTNCHSQPTYSQTSYWLTAKILINSDKTISLSKGDLVVVGKNPPCKPFHEGGNASILDPKHKHGDLCQIALGRKKIASP